MKSLVFLTLFLGLVDGRQMVELATSEETARVEVLLDGERQALISGGPPWRAPLDLGEELAPRRLEAIARDTEGRELGRVEQWLNLPRARAEVSLLVDRPAQGGATVQIGWRSVEHETAEQVRLFLDGASVSVGEWEGSSVAVALPPHDPDALHVVTAEVTFPGSTTARADTAFGAAYGDEVSSELSAVSVEVDGRGRLLEAAEVGPWLRVGGEIAEVVALDHGEADIYALVDEGARAELYQLAVELEQRMRASKPLTSTGSRERLVQAPLRRTGLRDGDRLYFVRPQVEDSPAGMELFGISQPMDVADGGTAWQIAFRRLPADPGKPQLLADAIATSGMWATDTSRPRALVLILGPDAEDQSRLEPRRVRGYLRRLGVPLTMFYVDLGVGAEARLREVAEAEGLSRRQQRQRIEAERQTHLEAARRRWGPEVIDIAGAGPWLSAHDRVRDELADQRVLWIEGRHPPQAVTLAGAPPWLRLLGGEVKASAAGP